MTIYIRNIVTALALLVICSAYTQAQTIVWPTPEVEKMYKDARELHAQGKLQPAINMYLLAINIAPNVMVLHRDLAQAYHISGDHQKAKETLEPIIKNGTADEQVYQIMAAALTSLSDRKKARNVLKDGIDKFPHSGMLYHELGTWYETDRDQEQALATWLTGIEMDPAYHLNYYEAARSYAVSNQSPVWTILYGETFVNIEQQTPRANEMRNMLIAAYKKLYNPMVQVADRSKKKKKETDNGFEQAVYDTYMQLAPVVNTGITTETLTMLRTRFLMDWTRRYASQYPFSLFYRQDHMVRNGYFDIYNEWLFGKAESQAQYDAWKKVHPDDLPDFEEWLEQNPYRPVASDFYNNKDISGIFKR